MKQCRDRCCEKCKEYGLTYEENYSPSEYLEGKVDSSVWIVGLNPKYEENESQNRTQEDLQSYFDDKSGIHPYFKDFGKVSSRLFDLLGRKGGAAHTDLIKCSTASFNFKDKDKKCIINNCQPYLKDQIKKHKPKLIICNGSDTSKSMLEILPPDRKSNEKFTCYTSNYMGYKVVVVLSGFIGRIDDYAKRRLGKEIEAILDTI